MSQVVQVDAEEQDRQPGRVLEQGMQVAEGPVPDWREVGRHWQILLLRRVQLLGVLQVWQVVVVEQVRQPYKGQRMQVADCPEPD